MKVALLVTVFLVLTACNGNPVRQSNGDLSSNLVARDDDHPPHEIYTVRDLSFYLWQITGNQVISGQFVGSSPPGEPDAMRTIQEQTGQLPGLVGIDYFYYNSREAADISSNRYAIEWWQRGGLVTVTASMPNPSTGNGLTDTSWLNKDDLLTWGTPTNMALNATLDQVAAGLQQLQNAGVVTIFRPFHENNGDWFWWGASVLSAEQFQALWRYTHDYLINNWGLNNVAWLYSVNTNTVLDGRWLLDTYPGEGYVDITGQDLYSDTPATDGWATYDALVKLGKPTSLAEFGSRGPRGDGDPQFYMPALVEQLRSSMPKVAFWQQWWSRNSGGNGWGMEIDQNAWGALNDPYVLNRGQLGF